MYRKITHSKTSITLNKSVEGETIEEKVDRIVNNKEPITDGAPLMYTERKNGVHAEFDPRTDRFEIAVDAMDKVTKTQIAKREAKILNFDKKDNGEAESTQGTSTN